MKNINDSFFEGIYKKIWKDLIPPILTEREVSFINSYFNLSKGSSILDLMCGFGRHAIALAEHGFHVTAIDNLQDYTDELNLVAANKNLLINVVNSDIITFKCDEKFDLIICMGNSLNFFQESDVRRIFDNVYRHLNDGGWFLINSWSISEIAARTFSEKSETSINGIHLETTSQFLFQPTRIEAEIIMSDDTGIIEKRNGIDYIFSISELDKLLSQYNLRLQEIFSIPGKKKFTIGEPRAYLIAQKI